MALCIFEGQLQQMACKTGEDCFAVAVTGGLAGVFQAAGQGSSDTDAGGECPFHSQFSASVPCGLTPYVPPAFAVSVADLSARPEAAPESRRLAIDHPPQLT